MKRELFAIGLSVLAASAMAQTKTVGATGADFTTIAAALAFFQPTDPDGSTANVINIIDSGVYDEALSITGGMTLAGTGVSRPTICARLGPTQVDANDGLCINIPASTTVNLTNLIVIPSLPPNNIADDLVRAIGTTGSILNMNNVLITANNGSNVPVTTTGLSAVSLTGATQGGDDGLFPSGSGATYNLTNVVVSHFQFAGANDGMVCSGTNTYNILDGCVFSFCNRVGIQAAGSVFNINAPTTRVRVIGNKGFAGIWFAVAQTAGRTINGCNIFNNVSATAGQGWGIEVQNRTITSTLSNMIVAGNGGPGINVTEVGTADVNISNVTCVNNAGGPLQTSAASTGGNVTATDCIFAGDGTTNVANAINANFAAGTINLDHCAVVTSGAAKLNTATTGSGTVNNTSVINSDPNFFQTSNFQNANFATVQNTGYAAAATASANLKGGGLYNPAADVQDWQLIKD